MKPIIMPQVGQDVTWARVVKWYKQEGDTIEIGDPVCEVESDKAALEVEAEVEGVLLKIIHAEGVKVDVFQPIAYVGAPGESVPDNGARPAQDAAGNTDAPPVLAPSASTPPPPGGVIAASPAAKRVAREHGIDLATVTGTGPGGRITQEDVEAVIGNANS
jgi:pyruvate/2-oxoglutarate dehydrogenase complex dihydrolipoamide acyltransferase (E2) component